MQKVDFFTDKELYFKDGRYISNKSYDHNTISIDIEDIENPSLVEDLSKIQEYLPDGHPDKVTKQKFEIVFFNFFRLFSNFLLNAVCLSFRHFFLCFRCCR